MPRSAYSCIGGDGRAIAYQRRAGPAAHQTDARPQVRANLQPIATSVVQRRHPLLADRIGTRQRRLRFGDGLVVEMGNQPIGGLPASALVSRTMMCRRMPKRTERPCAAALART